MKDLSNYLLKVEILSDSKVVERSGVSEKTGKDWHIKTQQAYIHLGKPYPSEFKIKVPDGSEPYPEGFYYLHPLSFKVSSYLDNIQLNDIVLIPIDEY